MKEQILAYLKTQGNSKSPTDIAKALNYPKRTGQVSAKLKELLAEGEVRRLQNGVRVSYKHKDN